MILKSIKYTEFGGQEREWSLETLSFGSKNLIVGKNSTGKSRTLNIISGLARMISGTSNMARSSKYEVIWDENGRQYIYSSETDNDSVISEALSIDGKVYLERGKGGIGSIFFEKIGSGEMVVFQTPPSEYAIAKRRDSQQHSFIEPLYEWAASLRHYRFGGHFGKDVVTLFNPSAPPIDENDENAVVGIFRNGKRDFGQEFIDAVVADINKVGFGVEFLDLGVPNTIVFQGLPSEPYSLLIKEKNVVSPIDQFSMSSGMYRVIALLTHLNYLSFKGESSCIVIDDVGEGLDHERACLLIDLLRAKSEQSSIQVIMSSNDNFVMNEVPLTEWTVLKRNGNIVSVSNYLNSAQQFDDFRFTGLSNFSFFEMDFLEDSGGEE